MLPYKRHHLDKTNSLIFPSSNLLYLLLRGEWATGCPARYVKFSAAIFVYTPQTVSIAFIHLFSTTRAPYLTCLTQLAQACHKDTNLHFFAFYP